MDWERGHPRRKTKHWNFPAQERRRPEAEVGELTSGRWSFMRERQNKEGVPPPHVFPYFCIRQRCSSLSIRSL